MRCWSSSAWGKGVFDPGGWVVAGVLASNAKQRRDLFQRARNRLSYQRLEFLVWRLESSQVLAGDERDWHDSWSSWSARLVSETRCDSKIPRARGRR